MHVKIENNHHHHHWIHFNSKWIQKYLCENVYVNVYTQQPAIGVDKNKNERRTEQTLTELFIIENENHFFNRRKKQQQ